MFRTILSTAAATIVLAASTVASSAAGDASATAVGSAKQPQADVSAGSFSPNGDGVKDVGVISYTVPVEADGVVLRIRGDADVDFAEVRVVELGRVSRGTYAWRWDGRDEQGTALPAGRYAVSLSAPGSFNSGFDHIGIDLDFSPRFEITHGPAYLPVGPHVIYPRSTDVRDVLEIGVLQSGSYDQVVRRVTLTVRDSRGRAVLRQAARRADDRRYFAHRWTARTAGQPLPPGRYRAVVSGVDRSGNRGRDAVTIRVSGRALEWRRRTYARPAAETKRDVCGWSTSYEGCGQPPTSCGEVAPSAIYAGGLSYRSRECAESPTWWHLAQALHFQPVPEAAVRGVRSAKVSFTGRPTAPGEHDIATLGVGSFEDVNEPEVRVMGSTEAVTPWVEYPIGYGARVMPWEEARPPGVEWTFTTFGTSSVDVEEFTVTVRYLAVAD